MKFLFSFNSGTIGSYSWRKHHRPTFLLKIRYWFFFFIFFFFWGGEAHLPGQGSNLSHSFDLCCSCSNAISLTHWATRATPRLANLKGMRTGTDVETLVKHLRRGADDTQTQLSRWLFYKWHGIKLRISNISAIVGFAPVPFPEIFGAFITF